MRLEKQIKSAMDHYQNACRKLLSCYPMYEYRSQVDAGYRLSILLIVGNEPQETLKNRSMLVRVVLGELLSIGQLLDTRLTVTVWSQDAREIGAQVCADAPDLPRFVQMNGVAQSKTLERKRAELTFTDTVPQNGDEWSYIIRMEEGSGLPADCAEDGGARVRAILMEDQIQVTAPEKLTMDTEIDPAQKGFLERVAYNIHYGYEKYQDPRASREEIDSSLGSKYNYAATLANVIHINSKLACCGIRTDNPEEAAAAFAKKMQDEPEIVDKLAVLEQYRWVLEKMLKGYRLPTNLNWLYTTEEGNRCEVWHPAILTCEETSRLELRDWRSDPEKRRSGLDELDRMSLEVHAKCKSIAEANRGSIEYSLGTIERTIGDLSKEVCSVQDEMLGICQAMRESISQMYQKKRIAIRRYRRRAQELKTLMEPWKTNRWKKSVDANLKTIEDFLDPLCQYIVDKDYKDLNYLMIQQIPFALTRKRRISMVKLFDTGMEDCQFAPWQMEPERVYYVAFADSAEYLDKLCERRAHIDAFLSHSCNKIEREFYILIPDELDVVSSDYQNIVIRRVVSREPAVIENGLAGILDHLEIDYADLTGGMQVLSAAMTAYACRKGIGTFYINGTRFYNMFGAAELEYPAPVKGISVLEMFKQTGADRMNGESANISDLSNVYEKFWEVSRSTEHWDSFCKFFADQYKETKAQTDHKLLLGRGKQEHKKVEKRLRSGILWKLLPILVELEQHSFIEELTVNWVVGNLMKLSFEAGEAAAKSLSDALDAIQKSDIYENSYVLKWTNNERVIQVKSLSVEGVKLPDELADEYEKILKNLQDKEIILDLSLSGVNGRVAAFRISTVEFLSALRNSGKVLEYYLYNTALRYCQFEDVDMSWKFYHSNLMDAAHNEVDVICTKGVTSLFISAKNVKEDTFKNQSNFLNYVCYEVGNLANRFGINAKMILAAPNLPQYNPDHPTELSKYVKHAMSRGVYLLGDVCFKGDRLGQVLENIAAGKQNWYEVEEKIPAGV